MGRGHAGVGAQNFGAVAQLGERRVRIAEARGSSPLCSTTPTDLKFTSQGPMPLVFALPGYTLPGLEPALPVNDSEFSTGERAEVNVDTISTVTGLISLFSFPRQGLKPRGRG